jgi:hypothetical protein
MPETDLRPERGSVGGTQKALMRFFSIPLSFNTLMKE